MIEDTSVNFGNPGSWTDLSSDLPVVPFGGLAPRAHIASDRALIVYQNSDSKSAEPEVAQLLAQARVVVPAVMNYLYFNSAKVAVVYFGKRDKDGQKFGIESGAEDFKVKMIRYLTSEIWPTLLRTDAPDESLGNDFLSRHGGDQGRSETASPTTMTPRNHDSDGGGHMIISAGNSVVGGGSSPSRSAFADEAHGLCPPLRKRHYSKETAQELSWFKKSVENRMQVLLYLKRGVSETKYLKLVLNNSAHRVHFDVVHTKEEKYRWDLRMLYTRLMDNLETQKAIDSYEAYEANFRLACATAAANVLELERPLQPMTTVTIWGTSTHEEPIDLGYGSGNDDYDDDYEVMDREVADPSHAYPADAMDRSVGHPGPADTSLTSCSASPSNCSPGAVSRSFKRPAITVDSPTTPSLAGVGSPPIRVPPAKHNADDGPVGGVLDGYESGQGSGLTLAPVTPVRNNNTFAARTRGPTLNPSKARYYRWMENLQRPESTTLDYKSYFSHTAQEIRHHCVKFMCGFLNAYRQGKLVIGVHEIRRRDSDGALETGKPGQNNIILHNDLVDQFVVGVKITEAELREMQEYVSERLLCCVPPVPPQAVAIDLVPVVFPVDFAFAQRILVLYEASTYSLSRDPLKQKSNFALHFLNPLGLSLIPLDLVDGQLEDCIVEHRERTAAAPEFVASDADAGLSIPELRFSPAAGSPASARPEFSPTCLKAEAYMIASISDSTALAASDWEAQLTAALTTAKPRCQYFFTDWPAESLGRLSVPQLHVVEVSVDIRRCGIAQLLSYRGKFFAGWPSIPIWDAATRTVRRVERNYNLFGDASSTHDAAAVAAHGGTSASLTPYSHNGGPGTVSSPYTYLNASSAAGFQRAVVKYGWCWWTNMQIINNVLSYLYGQRRVNDVLQFRRAHPVWNRVFEFRQGTPLVHMIRSTPVGVPMFDNSVEHISRTQYAFVNAGVPPMPLILCRIYEIIGNMPSPYPFVTVPLVQQPFRVSPFLVSIFYRQRYFDGTMAISVVLDLRDGILKTMQLRDGNLVLEAIVGMCFEKMNKRQVTRQLEGIEAKRQATMARAATMRARAGSGVSHSIGHGQGALPNPHPHHRPPAGHHDPRYAGSFLARRTLQPQMLRNARGRMSSTVLSPVASDCTRLTRREVEPNIPLIHFRFLTRKLLEDGAFVVTGISIGEAARSPTQPSRRMAPAAGGGQEATPSAFAAQQGTSWTLQHLLSWYNALLTDTVHIRFFGYGDRSVAFDVADFSEICEDDVESGALDLATATDIDFAACREKCTLHTKVKEWMNV